jgi:hypothetical protein
MIGLLGMLDDTIPMQDLVRPVFLSKAAACQACGPRKVWRVRDRVAAVHMKCAKWRPAVLPAAAFSST